MPQPYSQSASGAVFLPGYGWMSQQDYLSLGIDPSSLGSPAPAASPSFAGSPSGAGLAPGMMFPGYTPPINVPLVPPPAFNFPDVPSTVAGGGDNGPTYNYPGYADPGLGLPTDEGQPPAVAQGPAASSPNAPFAPPAPPGAGGPVAPPSLPNVPEQRGFDWGGLGEPAGYFGVQPQNPIGVFGVGGPTMPAGGGSYFGGRTNPAMWLPGSTYNLGGGGPVNLSSIGGWSGRAPWYISRMGSPINYGGHSTDAPSGYRLSPSEHAWLAAGGVRSGAQGPGIFSNYLASANAVAANRERSGAGLGGAGRPMTKPT